MTKYISWSAQTSFQWFQAGDEWIEKQWWAEKFASHPTKTQSQAVGGTGAISNNERETRVNYYKLQRNADSQWTQTSGHSLLDSSFPLLLSSPQKQDRLLPTAQLNGLEANHEAELTGKPCRASKCPHQSATAKLTSTKSRPWAQISQPRIWANARNKQRSGIPKKPLQNHA